MRTLVFYTREDEGATGWRVLGASPSRDGEKIIAHERTISHVGAVEAMREPTAARRALKWLDNLEREAGCS